MNVLACVHHWSGCSKLEVCVALVITFTHRHSLTHRQTTKSNRKAMKEAPFKFGISPRGFRDGWLKLCFFHYIYIYPLVEKSLFVKVECVSRQLGALISCAAAIGVQSLPAALRRLPTPP